MKVEELPSDALQELKQRYYCDRYNCSYDELAKVDNLVNDKTILEYYQGTEFYPDDFMCLCEADFCLYS